MSHVNVFEQGSGLFSTPYIKVHVSNYRIVGLSNSVIIKLSDHSFTTDRTCQSSRNYIDETRKRTLAQSIPHLDVLAKCNFISEMHDFDFHR